MPFYIPPFDLLNEQERGHLVNELLLAYVHWYLRVVYDRTSAGDPYASPGDAFMHWECLRAYIRGYIHDPAIRIA